MIVNCANRHDNPFRGSKPLSRGSKCTSDSECRSLAVIAHQKATDDVFLYLNFLESPQMTLQPSLRAPSGPMGLEHYY